MHEISRIAERLAANEQPIFYINRPASHLLGVEEWVANFYSIQLRDLWPVRSDRVFLPSKRPRAPLSHEDSVLWLLRSPEVQRFIAEKTPSHLRPRVIVYFMHDQETEDLCAELGYDLVSITVAERVRLDSKLLTTQWSEEAGLVNVPHVITQVASYAELIQAAADADLGRELVVQTDYGEAGAGTYFIRSEDDFAAASEHILGKTLKVMKRIAHRSLAMDAVVTPQGVIAGPLLQDIIGHPEIAIHKGASSGLEFYPDVLPEAERRRATEMVVRYGEVLKNEGYLGLFEVDILHDLDSGELFFGEANPRFSGCAMISNATTAEFWNLPLYALHIYAFLGFDDDIDVAAINDTWNRVPKDMAWSNILLRHVSHSPEEIVAAPPTGRYRLEADGTLTFIEAEPHWFSLRESDEVFFLSYRSAGDTKVYGSEIGSLYRRGRFQDYEGKLTPDTKTLIEHMHGLFVSKPLSFMTRASNSASRRARQAFSRLRRG